MTSGQIFRSLLTCTLFYAQSATRYIGLITSSLQLFTFKQQEEEDSSTLAMSAPNPLPKYIYKILPSPPQDPLPKEFPLSQLDANDGFVHLSTATQVLNTT